MSELIVPPGRATGCLPRVTKVGECCPVFGEKIKVVPAGEWSDWIGEIERRPHVHKIKDQGGVGSCATQSVSQAVEIVRSVQGNKFEELNPLSIYRITSGGRDRGSNIDTNLKHVRDVGILPESYFPHDNRNWKASPPSGWEEVAKNYRIDEFFDITTTEEVGSALLIGFPVCFGWEGHSCVLLELLNETEALYANSWGTGWGDAGFGTIKLSQINFSYGAFAVRTSTQADDAVPLPEVP